MQKVSINLLLIVSLLTALSACSKNDQSNKPNGLPGGASAGPSSQTPPKKQATYSSDPTELEGSFVSTTCPAVSVAGQDYFVKQYVLFAGQDYQSWKEYYNASDCGESSFAGYGDEVTTWFRIPAQGKIDFTSMGGTKVYGRDIYQLQNGGNNLAFGSGKSVLDAEGRPTQIDTQLVFVREN
jgi:hypothetical protein